jgi:hypothetical protein
VYNLIEVHRNRALKKLKRRRRAQGVEPGNKEGRDSDDRPSSHRVGADENRKRAIQAIESLTKLDVAELRTMSKPPPAVEMVVEALMAVLLGEKITFSDARKLMANTDR